MCVLYRMRMLLFIRTRSNLVSKVYQGAFLRHGSYVGSCVVLSFVIGVIFTGFVRQCVYARVSRGSRYFRYRVVWHHVPAGSNDEGLIMLSALCTAVPSFCGKTYIGASEVGCLHRHGDMLPIYGGGTCLKGNYTSSALPFIYKSLGSQQPASSISAKVCIVLVASTTHKMVKTNYVVAVFVGVTVLHGEEERKRETYKKCAQQTENGQFKAP